MASLTFESLESPDVAYVPGHVYRAVMTKPVAEFLVLHCFRRTAFGAERSTVVYMFTNDAPNMGRTIGTVQLSDYLTGPTFQVNVNYPHSEHCPCMKEDS
jgi:hypothetical protein